MTISALASPDTNRLLLRSDPMTTVTPLCKKVGMISPEEQGVKEEKEDDPWGKGYVWAEKYRPQSFDEIVLDPFNRTILRRVIETNQFPNFLFYGPPGTGKTTTIINLIHAFHARHGIHNNDLVIHLNASDERGIDVIRNQIMSFVHSKGLFQRGTKFVILDEVDYMTKSAQQALRLLLQDGFANVRFCLICNYISKIDEGLQHEFVRLRFNQLPKDDILRFLQRIVAQEGLDLSRPKLEAVQALFQSDIRSMINFLQSNGASTNALECVGPALFDAVVRHVVRRHPPVTALHEMSARWNMDARHVVKHFFRFLLRHRIADVNDEWMRLIENVMHTPVEDDDIYAHYVWSKLTHLLQANPALTNTNASANSP